MSDIKNLKTMTEQLFGENSNGPVKKSTKNSLGIDQFINGEILNSKESELSVEKQLQNDTKKEAHAINLTNGNELNPGTELSETKEVNNDSDDIAIVETEKDKPEWLDVLGSGGIFMKTLKAGIENEKPENSDKCIINYTCKLVKDETADDGDIVENEQNFEFFLGEGDVIPGLDVAIRMMSKGQQCLLKIVPRLAYGEKGLLPKIPPNSNLLYDVELIDIRQDQGVENLSIAERQIIGEKKKERGNWWYQRGESTLAIQCYRRALDYLEEVENERDNDKLSNSELQQILEARLKVLNNMASAQIKVELYDQAVASLQTVLRCQPNNVKALYRRSKIHIVKQELPEALRLLEKARKLEPQDNLILKDINHINDLLQKQKLQEKAYAKRMFKTINNDKSKSSSDSDRGSKSKKFRTWAACGATIFVALASFVAYRIKYP